MDDSNASGLCEEPDADFFDTFFDDGVLETLGEVFAEKPSNDSEDSSIVEETISFSSPKVASDRKSNQASLQNTSIEDGHQKKTEVITFKPAQIHDQEKTSEHSTSNVKVNLKPDSSCVNSTSHNIVQRNALKQLTEFQRQCSAEVKLTNSQILASETFSHPKKEAEKEGSVSLEELLAKVSKFVKETPVCNENPREKQLQSNKHDERQAKNVIEVCASVNTQFSAATIVSENVGEDEKKKTDNQSLLKEPLSYTSTLGNSIEKNGGLSSEVVHTIIEEQEEEEEEGELKEDSVASSSILSTSNGCVTTGKSTNVTVKTGKSKDEAEKENDLTLEKTFHKNENFRCSSEKKTKISINLKSQLLASTTIINSGSASKSNGIFTNQNEKGGSSLSSKDIHSSLSSLSDGPGPSHNSLRDKQKRRRKSFSTDIESSDDGKCELRSDRRRRKSKKRSKDDDSPKPRRRKESKKSKHKRSRSRSRSRSPYRSYRRRMSPKRSSYKRQRASSKSPESHRGRKSRSPHRRRSRSRSRSKSKSKSVTRAKSPFINHVDRLYKQWGIEWGTEDKARRSLSHPSHHPMPAAGPWSSETANATSTTIVSNTLSVSGESLHVHSTSFTSIGAFPHGYQGYMSGVPSGYGSNHYGGAEYSNFNGETYSGFLPNQPAAVQVPALDQTLCLPEIPGLDTSIPPPMIQAIPEDNSLMPSLDTTIAPPSASVLRKQLDILKSTVASLPDPCVSTNKTGNDSALPIPNIPEVDNNTVNINETTRNLVSTDDNSTSLTPADKISKNSTSSCESSKISIRTDKSPKKSTSIDKSSTKNPIIISRPNLTPVVLSPDTSSKTQSKSQTNDEICLQESLDMTYLVENSDETKVSSSPNIIQSDSDSDIIIEEPPPKPPVELICLSPDEGDGGIENNSKLDDCGKGNNVELAANNNNGQNKDDEEVNNIYDLDKELDKIGKDNSKRLLVPPGYKKRKRKKGKKSSRKEIEDNSKNKEITRKEKPSSSETIPDETQNPVIKECLEMIDSLRIGRFVVVDKSNLEPITHKDYGISNSLLKTRPTTEFSFTKKTNLEVNSKTRNVSTNTSTQLCIDVCIGTDNTVMQKDANNQTNFKCSGCSDKMDLLQQMKIKLLQLEKECSDLRAKLEIQSIPGLDASSGPTATGSKESHLSVTSRNNLPSDFSRGLPNNSHSKLTGNLCSISSDKGKEPINESQRRKKMGEPPVAFDYCHESPYLHSPF